MAKDRRVIKNDNKQPETEIEKPVDKTVKYCPFKKATDIQYSTISEENQDLIQTAEIENFRECIGELCMAYETGRCKLMEQRPNNISL